MTKSIQIVGLGGGDINQLPLGIYKKLITADKIYLRTNEHPVVDTLKKEGIVFHSFDNIYEKHPTFEGVYEKIVEVLLNASQKENGSILYAVPGHPLVAERTVQLLQEKAMAHSIKVDIIGGQSFIDPVLTALNIDPIEGFTLLDGTAFSENDVDLRRHLVITQVYDQMTAGEVKLTLMDSYPDDYRVTIVTAAGTENEKLENVMLYELDRRFQNVNNLAVVYVPPVKKEESLYREFGFLREVIKILRSPDGCPWDRKQTHESLKKYLIEEAYEVLEAIDDQDDEHLIEELGDVLLQVLLHSQIGEDNGYFTIKDVIEAITEKMIRRHPHVFGDITVENADDVVTNWEEIKQKEKKQSSTVLANVSKSLPSLLRAAELQKKAAKVGFDWETSDPIWEKVSEELEEFKLAVEKQNQREMEKEFGDILFALVNLSRYYKIDPEIALNSSNRKFYCRFQYIESKLKEQQLDWADVSLSYLDELWEKAKNVEIKEGNS